MMFATVIGSMYGRGQVGRMAHALTDLCSPYDNYGWSPGAIYVFWHPKDRLPLYIGYSANVARRFAEHNGLIPCRPGASKLQQIDQFLQESNPQLIGFSILVQEKAVKIMGTRSAPDPANPMTPWEMDLDEIRAIESRLIEVWEKATGAKPRWNEAVGSVAGRERVVPNDLEVLEIMSFAKKSFIVAKSMIPELSEDPDIFSKEERIHSERIRLINDNLDERHFQISDDLLEYATGRQPFFD